MKPTVLKVSRVLGPSPQGISRPYRCIAEDGHLYYVKGQQTDRGSLWKEWIAGHLARALDLPVPPFALLQIDEALWRELPADWQEIGMTPAFGSRQRGDAAWLEPSMAGKVPVATQQALLVFDWWIRNADRMTGNTNLLWDAQRDELVVIDHNQAFDAGFDPLAFVTHHVFASQWATMQADLFLQGEWTKRLAGALPAALAACHNAPHEWRYANAELDISAAFQPESALEVLARCEGPELWRTD